MSVNIQHTQTINAGEIPEHLLIPMVRVRRKVDGKVALVNRSEFNATHHIFIEEFDRHEHAAAAAVREPEARVSLYERSDFASMDIETLMAQPEWPAVPRDARRKLRTKQEYVDAIMAARDTIQGRGESAESAPAGDADGPATGQRGGSRGRKSRVE